MFPAGKLHPRITAGLSPCCVCNLRVIETSKVEKEELQVLQSPVVSCAPRTGLVPSWMNLVSLSALFCCSRGHGDSHVAARLKDEGHNKLPSRVLKLRQESGGKSVKIRLF
jgi:hypothetical protein